MTKKIITLVTIVFMFGCSQAGLQNEDINSGIKAVNEEKLASSNSNVVLKKAWTSASYYHGMGSEERDFYVEVKNIGFEKNVKAVNEDVNGDWIEIELSYVKSLSNGNELWSGSYKFTNSYPNGNTRLSNEFAICYEVNGETYWDNNNGNNYSMTYCDGSLFGPLTNVSVDEDMTYISQYGNTFYLYVDVKNIAFNKSVKVVYTTDDWNTSTTKELTYTSIFQVGYAQIVRSPNVHDVERWYLRESLDENITEVEYAVSYEVNGQTYWDNNDGLNYTAVLR